MQKQVQFILTQTVSNFWLGIEKIIRASYQQSLDYCNANFPFHVTNDLIAIYRRSIIEREIEILAADFNYTAVPKLNKSRNASHIEITAGNLIITQHFVGKDSNTFHPAIYQQGLAQINGDQIHIFEGFTDNVRAVNSSFDDNSKYYLSIYHGAVDRLPQRPGFIEVGFPLRQSEEKISLKYEPITISKLHSDLNPDPIKPTKISDEAIPTLKNVENKKSKNI